MKKIILGSLMLCCLFGVAEAQKKGKVPPPPPPLPLLDPNNPEDAIKMDRKITSSLKDGENCWYFWEGNVFSRIAGEPDKLLFHYYGTNVRASKTVMDPEKGYGWRHVSRELLFYLDPKTKEIVHTWKNPWSGEECEVFHVANDPVNGRGPSFAKGPGGDYKLKGTFYDGMYLQTSEIPLFYENPLGGDYQKFVGGTYHAMEIFNTVVPESELRNPNKDKADDVMIAWTRISKFLPWMRMGDRAGWCIFSGTGKKISGFDKLPKSMQDEILKNYPEYTQAPPTDDARPNETSWTVFKKKMAQKKAAGAGEKK
jgi:hypothetical protein